MSLDGGKHGFAEQHAGGSQRAVSPFAYAVPPPVRDRLEIGSSTESPFRTRQDRDRLLFRRVELPKRACKFEGSGPVYAIAHVGPLDCNDGNGAV